MAGYTLLDHKICENILQVLKIVVSTHSMHVRFKVPKT
jgi:hypothetical protein